MNPCLTMPGIFKETSAGFVIYSIGDEMLKRREIDCIGEITAELVHSFILPLRYLQAIEPEEEITIYINSQGGEVTAGLALYDVMQSLTCPIKTLCMGQVSSMGALLFISGNKRKMLKHSKIMIHDPLIGNVAGNVLTIERVADNIMKTRELTANIIAKHTGRTIEAILEKTAVDSYFDADEAIEFGLEDSII